MVELIDTLKASKSGILYKIKCALASKYYNSFHNAMEFTQKQFYEYQKKRFEKTIRHCIVNVPYYREHKKLYVENNKVLPIDQMPIIPKQLLRENIKRFFADKRIGYCRFHATSGTSGSPLRIKASYKTHSMVTAGILRFTGMYGLKSSHRTACLTGFFNPATGNSKKIVWRDYAAGRLFLSIYQFNDSRVAEYAKVIRKFGPDELFGYASSLNLLAQAFKRNHIEPIKTIKVVTSTSEVMYSDWRKCIEDVFAAPVADQYGSQELQCLITQCPKGTMHINPEFGIIEVIDDDGNILPIGKEGQMLLTGLANNAMPLVRYQIGDRTALLALNKPCECGLSWPAIKSVSGRSEDAIITPDGRPLMYLNFHCTEFIKGIIESQFVQDSEDHVTIKLTVGQQFSKESEQVIIADIHNRSQFDFKVDFEYLDKIPRGARGKFKAVVNLLDKK